MFQLLETMIAFSVIMLMLSFLVKSLTSVVKNYVDYYSHNLKGEVERLLFGYLEKGNWDTWSQQFQVLKNINWRRLSEEYLNRENMEWILIRLGVPKAELTYLESRLTVHRANLRYAFETRTKNISLAVGLALCLFLNINALTIWKTLYNSEQMRGQYTNEQAVKKAQDLGAKLGAASPQGKDGQQAQEAKATTAEEAKKSLDEFTAQLKEFQQSVPFGMGQVWRLKQPQDPLVPEPGALDLWTWFYEFLGSLLTGILVSIGAPYWHDLLRALSAIRPTKKPEPGA
ncbi:MAG: hypothetical protein V1806_16095 [Pseudomonadota bacterium]